MHDHVNEHDEFLLSQLLDGDLPETQAALLRARLETEPALRRAFEVLSRVDRLVRSHRHELPEVAYTRFHNVFMQRLAVEGRAVDARAADAEVSLAEEVIADAGCEVSEQDEFVLSQLLDGGLAGAQQDLIVQRMAAEPALQAAFDALARVDTALDRHRSPVPAVDYDRFHTQVMKQIRAEAGKTARTLRFPVWARFAAPLAAAAAIAMVVWMQPGLRQDRPTPGFGDVLVQQDPTPDPGSMIAVLPPDAPAEPVVVVMTHAPGSAASRGEIAIEFGKLASAERPVEAIQVSFNRSADIAGAVQQGDDERARQPARRVFVASANPSYTVQTGLTGELF